MLQPVTPRPKWIGRAGWSDDPIASAPSAARDSQAGQADAEHGHRGRFRCGDGGRFEAANKQRRAREAAVHRRIARYLHILRDGMAICYRCNGDGSRAWKPRGMLNVMKLPLLSVPEKLAAEPDP